MRYFSNYHVCYYYIIKVKFYPLFNDEMSNSVTDNQCLNRNHLMSININKKIGKSIKIDRSLK